MVESLTTLIVVTALLLGSPGPAPLALAATGAVYGIRQGIPFLAGILVGLAVAATGAAVGAASLLAAAPQLSLAVRLAGGGYILYIAWRIASGPVALAEDEIDRTRPKFRDGFILNLLNPKAYAALFAIYSQFSLPLPAAGARYVATALVCLAVAAVVDAIWLAAGGAIRPVFAEPRQARALRVAFGVAMAGVTFYALFR